MNKKWKFVERLHLCACGACFPEREGFVEHLKDTKRWRKYHYTPDYSTNKIGFIIWKYTKRTKK
jgi:hypothetical protein